MPSRSAQLSSDPEASSVSDGAQNFDAYGDPGLYQRGHRERLRTRFVEGGANALPDYELLELVLFAAIPQKNVKPLARALIDRFGGFAEVLAAPPARLMETRGIKIGAVTQMKIVEAAALRMVRRQLLGKPALSSWSALIDYCTAAMARDAREQFRVLFLDRKNVLIEDEVLNRGTVDHTPVYPREIVKRALELSASAVILVHNHPTHPLSITLDHATTH